MERRLNHRDSLPRIAGATHENIDRGKIPLRPRVDRDVTLRQHHHARHAAIRREVVEVAMQDGRTRNYGTLTQRTINKIGLIKVPSTP